MITSEQWIAGLAPLVADLASGDITEADFIEQVAALTNDWSGLLYSNPGLAHTQAELIANLGPLQTREFMAWAAGAADGGLAGDGRYPLTVGGVATPILSPAAINTMGAAAQEVIEGADLILDARDDVVATIETIEGLKADSEAAAGSAEASATAAGLTEIGVSTVAIQAALDRLFAANAAVAATAARDMALQYRNEASAIAGGDFQPHDATLDALAALNNTAGLLEQTGADTFTRRAIGVGGASSIPTRSDGDGRWQAKSGVLDQVAGSGLTSFVAGLFNSASAGALRAAIGLGNVANVTPANMPISDPAAAALATKAPLDSPALTGSPTVPTPALGASSTQVANTAWVQANSGTLVGDLILSENTAAGPGRLKPDGALYAKTAWPALVDVIRQTYATLETVDRFTPTGNGFLNTPGFAIRDAVWTGSRLVVLGAAPSSESNGAFSQTAYTPDLSGLTMGGGFGSGHGFLTQIAAHSDTVLRAINTNHGYTGSLANPSLSYKSTDGGATWSGASITGLPASYPSPHFFPAALHGNLGTGRMVLAGAVAGSTAAIFTLEPGSNAATARTCPGSQASAGRAGPLPTVANDGVATWIILSADAWNSCWVSTDDAATWSIVSLPVTLAGGGLDCVQWCGDRFIIVSAQGAAGLIMTSTDGQAWTQVLGPSGFASVWVQAWWSEGLGCFVLRSSDGAAWLTPDFVKFRSVASAGLSAYTRSIPANGRLLKSAGTSFELGTGYRFRATALSPTHDVATHFRLPDRTAMFASFQPLVPWLRAA